MKDFITQAEINGIILNDLGDCQFCGAKFEKGVFDCVNQASQALELFDFNDLGFHQYRFLSVDAHALQHPEIHGRWSNHFHLSRLHLILEKKLNWDYKTSPLLSNYLNQYKLKNENEVLNVPPVLSRGEFNSKHLLEAESPQQMAEIILAWANTVYLSWQKNHALVAKISEGFLNQNPQLKRADF